jgi:phage gpG-like protein
MSSIFTVTINNGTVIDALNKLFDRGQDMQPVLHAIGQELENRVRARFETKTDPEGEKWDGWKPSTQKRYDKADTVGKSRKAKVVRKGSLLDREGHMLGSLSYQVESDGVRVGFGMPYAIYHEFGTVNMARRGILANEVGGNLGTGDKQAILDLVQSYFAKPI